MALDKKRKELNMSIKALLRNYIPETDSRMLDREMVRNERFDRASRIFDFLFSIVTVVVFFIPALLLALLIWIDSPGASPIFRQERVGIDGHIFNMLKFRSMVPGAEEHLGELLDRNERDGPVFKMKNDPRITRIGRFIRKMSLDEFPQFINVLAGDMSIVGPRPALPREVDQYGEYEKQRLLVKPGLTCLWQIQSNRNEMSFAEWLALDLAYIKHRNARLNLRIIVATVGAVLHGDGE